ncbi:MAG: class II fructose-bisphosphate aldolase [Trueperaceae bacterium]
MPAAFSQQELDAAAVDLALAPAGQRAAKAAALRRQAADAGVHAGSIGAVYRAFAEGKLAPMTVPAMNLRGLTYLLARAVFRAVDRLDAGPVMFELAPSESDVSDQSFAEYGAQVLAAAAREGHRGPVYLQGDHFEVAYDSDGGHSALMERSRAAVAAGVRQIDLDAAGLADGSAPSANERQRPNALATAHMLAFLRRLDGGDELVVGGEVGEIGGANTTPEELRTFLTAVSDALPAGMRGLDKVSVQTGTRHGGVVRKDGSVGEMSVDLELTAILSDVARSEFGLPGVVQHGASTLSTAQLAQLPDAGVIEVHLATGIQNLVFEHGALPREFTDRINRELDSTAEIRPDDGGESASHAESGHYDAPGELSERQRFVMNRWKAWGRYKRELWTLESGVQASLGEAMEAWATELLTALQVAGKREAVGHLVVSTGSRA